MAVATGRRTRKPQAATAEAESRRAFVFTTKSMCIDSDVPMPVNEMFAGLAAYEYQVFLVYPLKTPHAKTFQLLYEAGLITNALPEPANSNDYASGKFKEKILEATNGVKPSCTLFVTHTEGFAKQLQQQEFRTLHACIKNGDNLEGAPTESKRNDRREFNNILHAVQDTLKPYDISRGLVKPLPL